MRLRNKILLLSVTLIIGASLVACDKKGDGEVTTSTKESNTNIEVNVETNADGSTKQNSEKNEESKTEYVDQGNGDNYAYFDFPDAEPNGDKKNDVKETTNKNNKKNNKNNKNNQTNNNSNNTSETKKPDNSNNNSQETVDPDGVWTDFY